MPLEKLIERIMNDARERADAITEEAQRKREKVLGEADARAEELYQQEVSAARRSAEDERKRRVTIAALDARKSILEEKQALVQEVFDRAIQAVASMPREQYVDFVVRFLVSAASDEGGEVILSPADRERLGEEVVSRANEELVGAGKTGGLVLSTEMRDIKGGFILKTEGLETNNSLDAIVGSRRDELEARVVEALFPESA